MNGAHLLDRYLLGEPVSKPDVVAALLSDRSLAAGAAPFYRAFEAVGARAADEAFVALRLILAQRTPDDALVRRLRALAALARAGATGDRKGVRAAMQRDGDVLGDVPAGAAEPNVVATLARAAYFRELDH
ncbi:MAG: hypothetical protein M3R53_10730 [Candidatus Eremiobacteraeota bacterium]|nr:hypothetical protein [Candidatus Eremiobacteraeota bacterium]